METGAARKGRNEKQENEKLITVTAGPFGELISNYSYSRASAGELVLDDSYRRALSRN